MIRWSLAESAGHFWWPAEFVNVANPDFGNLRHLQNPGHLSLTAPSTKQKYHVKYGLCRECKKVESAEHNLIFSGSLYYAHSNTIQSDCSLFPALLSPLHSTPRNF